MKNIDLIYLGSPLTITKSFIEGDAPISPPLNFIHQWMSTVNSFDVQTSGSTGTPKIIVITRKQIIASITQTQKALNLQKGDSCLINLSANHIAGKMMIARSLEIGMKMTIVPPSKNPLIDINEPFDFYSFVPLQIQSIIEETPESISLLNQSKAIIIGGAKVSYHLQTLIEKHISAPIFSTFGMTETVSHIALKRLNNKESVFTKLKEIHIDIDDRNCLKIKGEVTNNKWIQTNDIVKLTQFGFEWLGRFDNVINSGGIKLQVESIEKGIEKAFQELSIKNRFIVFGEHNRLLGESVSLIIEGEAVSKRNILQHIALFLEKYEIPKNIYIVQKFHETASNKINRKKVIESISLH